MSEDKKEGVSTVFKGHNGPQHESDADHKTNVGLPMQLYEGGGMTPEKGGVGLPAFEFGGK